jgi:hypothetical protein
VGRLDLETLRTPSSTSLLELPSLGSNVGLSSLEGSTEVLDGPRRNWKILSAILVPFPNIMGQHDTHSLTFLFPLNKTVLEPVGALKASWSKVKISPPLATILSLAERVKPRAATVSLGTSGRRSSSRTFPTTTTVLEPCIIETSHHIPISLSSPRFHIHHLPDAHVGVLTLRLLDDTGDRDGGTVDPGHKEPLEDSPVEPRLSPSGEEAVKL